MRKQVHTIVNSAAMAGNTSASVPTTVTIDTASPAAFAVSCCIAIYCPILIKLVEQATEHPKETLADL